jgi:hypothetical protein
LANGQREKSGAVIAPDAKDKDVAEEKAAADASKSSGDKASNQTPKHALEDCSASIQMEPSP